MRTVLLVTAPALLLTAALTGCANGQTATPAAATTTTSPAAAATTTPAGSAAPSPTASASGAACTAENTSASITAQEPLMTGKSVHGLIGVTNTGKETCTLEGWLTVVLGNAHGDAVKVKVANVEQPGKSVLSTLKPGTTAFAGMKWTQCDKGDSSCPAGNSLQITVPGASKPSKTSLEEFPAPEKSGIGLSKVQMGTLQPSRQGVVAW